MHGPHWCEFGVIEAFGVRQIDCVSVLEGLKIPGFDDEVRSHLGYGRRVVMHIKEYLNTQKCLISFGLNLERKRMGQDIDEEKMQDLFDRATTRWSPTDEP